MQEVDSILKQFGPYRDIVDVRAVVNAGGFSGAKFWRVSTSGGDYCLRRWPREHPDAQRLTYIHRILTHVAYRGLHCVPDPITTTSGGSFVRRENHLWELTRWLPGKAEYRQRPSEQKLRDALGVLARFHQATADMVSDPPILGCAPGIQLRADRLERLLGGRIEELADAVAISPVTEVSSKGQQILKLFPELAPALVRVIERAKEFIVRLQPCIRDIWHDHVLFTGEVVTGLIDFGAMNQESVAADIARLLGSMVGDATDQWSIGIKAYQSVRPLNDQELELVQAFDFANVALSGIQWIEWIFIEQREFLAMDLVANRLDEIACRMKSRYVSR